MADFVANAAQGVVRLAIPQRVRARHPMPVVAGDFDDWATCNGAVLPDNC
jgi:hypothetical protein